MKLKIKYHRYDGSKNYFLWFGSYINNVLGGFKGGMVLTLLLKWNEKAILSCTKLYWFEQ